VSRVNKAVRVFVACANLLVLVLEFPIFDHENDDEDEDDFGCGSAALRLTEVCDPRNRRLHGVLRKLPQGGFRYLTSSRP
jgi:hypothetical protein